MFSGKKILAVVPARGGSKGVPLKNIHPLLGIPLIAYVGDLIKKTPLIDRAIVSTDHVGIAGEARKWGIEVPFIRPEELSGDKIGDCDVLSHALVEIEKVDGFLYDVVLMLQPTSPLRKPEYVVQCIEKLVAENLDSVWTVSPTDLKYHPLKQLTVSEKGELGFFDSRGSQIIARQQLGPVFHRNGACYAFTRECLLEQKTIMGRKSGAVVIHEKMVSIDTLDDFKLAEEQIHGLGIKTPSLQ